MIISFFEELKRLRGSSNMEQIEAEIQLMDSEVTAQLEKKTLFTVILDPTLRLPVILTCVIQGSQQLSGITSVNKFSLYIYNRFSDENIFSQDLTFRLRTIVSHFIHLLA